MRKIFRNKVDSVQIDRKLLREMIILLHQEKKEKK